MKYLFIYLYKCYDSVNMALVNNTVTDIINYDRIVELWIERHCSLISFPHTRENSRTAYITLTIINFISDCCLFILKPY